MGLSLLPLPVATAIGAVTAVTVAATVAIAAPWAPVQDPGGPPVQDPGGPPARDLDGPPARALSLELTSSARLAGTSGSLRAAKFVTRLLTQAGWRVELDEREVLLSLPRHLTLSFLEDGSSPTPFHERRERFDADAVPPGDLPLFNAWSASGTARGEVVDAGYGTRADFERLRGARIDLAGRVALCRYGKGYRGIKVALAEEYGCAGVLLFSDPDDDGAGKGDTWPAGPWKPSWAGQRGSIGPMALGPGDPSTPGFPSPAPGQPMAGGRERLDGAALAARLPAIPCLPIGAAEAALLIERLSTRRVLEASGTRRSLKIGPGPVTVVLTVDAPPRLRTIRNVIARLEVPPAGNGNGDGFYVIAGNHRDAWVRGAQDAGSGTVTLLRAAQHLGARVRAGWRPAHGIWLAFWDAEEQGLIGSTEWGEANAAGLQGRCLAYVNADAVVGGLAFHASGTPGLEAVLGRALAQVGEPSPPGAPAALMGRTLLDQWRESAEGEPRLGLPGSGSDFTVFLHHLGLPVIDLGFGGNGGGQYHTVFDDFAVMDRFIDPGWVGHETAGRLVAALLAELAAGDAGDAATFDDARAAREMARHAQEAAGWLGEERSASLAAAFEALARAVEEDRGSPPADGQTPRPRFYQALAHPAGLEGRPWFKNQLWAPGLEAGYGSETFPCLRAAAAGDDGDSPPGAALDAALARLLERIEALTGAWTR